MRKLVSFLTILILIAAFYLGVALLTFRNYFHLPVYAVIVVAAILAVLLALLSFLLRKPIQAFVDQISYRETYDYRQILLNLSSKMGNILNLEQLSQEVLFTLSKAFRISKVVLLLEDRDGSSFTTQFIYPKDKTDNQLHLLLDSSIVLWLQKEFRPLNVRQMESTFEFEGMDLAERDALSDLELICPLKSHSKLIGILGLGKKQSNKPYSKDDLELIMSTIGQAGIILENALLYRDIIRYSNESKAL
jgi:transcriptional regulator with GAF, ATPase, and Fis domain